MIKIEHISDTGPKRKQNEDSTLIKKNALGHTILVVADGMGGHNAGEVASKMACDIVADEFSKINDNIRYQDFIKKVIEKANAEIYKGSLMDSSFSKMGTTISLVIYDGEKIFTGHVGDSRIYFINESRILQITKDHTLVQAMVEAGTLQPEDVKNSKLKNVLVQALGTSKGITIEVKEIKLPKEFTVILCSDGLTGEISDLKIKEVMNRKIDLLQRVEELISLANKIDGSDNVSVIGIEKRC